MGKKSSPELPPVPTFQANANVSPNIDFLSSVGKGLASGNFMNASDPQLGFLNDLVSLNPEATQRAVQLASRDTVDIRNKAQQDFLNQLEANNQLTSSVTGNRLSDLNEAFSSDIADIATNFYLADVNRAFSNTASLFELGLNTTGNATNLGLNDQGQRNEFALQNYNNQLAASLAGQKSGSGGFLGGSLGTLLGGGLGFAVGGPGGAAIGAGLGGAAGGGIGELFSPSQSGAGAAGFTQAGLGLAGAGFANTNFFGTPQATPTDAGAANRTSLLNQRLLGRTA